MRELLDGVRYRPASARYKVYIIDEVHMPTSAFNAPLKTLEELPEHGSFARRRSARFGHRAVALSALRSAPCGYRNAVPSFLKIAGAEGVTIAPGAVGMSRAADGSVRDGHRCWIRRSPRGRRDPRSRRAITLGLADRVQIFDLFDSLMLGDAKAALDLLGSMYAAGADPSVVMQDLLDSPIG
jgi:DNA polymerase-3 subunit gamma/tau